jgi:hypothetical protein
MSAKRKHQEESQRQDTSTTAPSSSGFEPAEVGRETLEKEGSKEPETQKPRSEGASRITARDYTYPRKRAAIAVSYSPKTLIRGSIFELSQSLWSNNSSVPSVGYERQDVMVSSLPVVSVLALVLTVVINLPG